MLKRLLIIVFLLPFLTKAQNYPVKPSNYITDETGTLTQEQQNSLNAKLKAFEDTTTNQIFVYITSSLNGQDLAQYSEEIFHNWKIGQKDKNNGILIAIFKDDHKFRIQTGYGLEGQLPDLLTKRIQDNDMRPLFKQGDYYGGINTGIDFLTYYSCHAFDSKLINGSSPAETVGYTSYWQSWLIGYSINILFLIFYIRNVLRGKKNLSKKQKKKEGSGTVRKTIFITIAVIIAIFPCVGGFILMFMVIFTSDFKGFSSRGSYSSSSSSSWSSSDSSWSSSSSSDFGGGGGGDSGGGGSSSDW
jgi:uncharacterized protein